MPDLSAKQIAELVDGTLHGDAGRRLSAVAPLDSAGPEDVSFVAGRAYLSYLPATRAGLVLAPEKFAAEAAATGTWVCVDDPHMALAKLLPALYPPPPAHVGVHPTALVASSAAVDPSAWVGPFCTLGEGVNIGAGAQIHSHCVIAEGCSIGAGTVVHPHSTLHHGVQVGKHCIIFSGARVGSDGFGYASSAAGHQRVLQVGGCVIGDHVEIGANTTIDRGSIGDTVIGAGTKIDNLVHIGHNVRIGEHVLILAQVGISGSTSVGDHAVLAGQAGIGGHLRIGNGARVAGQAGVTGDVAAGETVSGYPARPHREALRAQAALFRLPKLLRRLQQSGGSSTREDDQLE